MVNSKFALIIALIIVTLTGCTSYLPDDGNQTDCTGDGDCDITCYRDNDLDGMSTPQSTVFHFDVCEDGWTPYPGNDCNDNDITLQFNCMSMTQTFCFFDEDGDGHGVNPGSYFPGATCPNRWVTTEGDCAPTDPTKFVGCSTCTPGAEICDGKDNDCDGSIDEGGICGCQPETTDETGTTMCNDGKDNDCDGKTDALDPGCNVCTATGALIGQSVTLSFSSGTFPSDLASVGGQGITRNNARLIGWNCNGVVQTASVGSSLTIQIPSNCPGGWLLFDVFLDGSVDGAGNPDEILYASFAGHAGQSLGQLGGFTASYTNNGVTTQYAPSDIRIGYDPTCSRFSSDSRLQSQFRNSRPLRIEVPIDSRCTGGQMPPDRFPSGTCN